MNPMIFVRFNVEGFHYWPSAPKGRFYLGQKHRHQFYVEVSCEVKHDDREIEFHDLLDVSKHYFPGGDMDEDSCEMMAHDLAKKLAYHYDRPFSVSVSEDNEVGAICSFDKLREVK